uniref:BPTI/Kunitz inhibitor domain-containing protein n=1 Tax=Monodelphis domestica TaxID=13616 RepID=A0A5F8H2L8_MONDO
LQGIPSYCNLPLNIDSCNGNYQEAKIQFFYNSTARSCEPFDYKGCRGNRNNFLTRKMCQDNCKESIPDKSPTLSRTSPQVLN